MKIITAYRVLIPLVILYDGKDFSINDKKKKKKESCIFKNIVKLSEL